MTISDQISLALLMVTAVLGLYTASLQSKSNKLQHQKNLDQNELEHLRQMLSNYKKKISSFTWHDDPFELCVLVLGPRASGKSSIVELWSKSWINIMNISATAQWAEHSQYIDGVGQSAKKNHPDFDIECTFLKGLKLLIRDYAGEDPQRVDALKHLSKMATRIVILFVFKVGYSNNEICFTDANADYFSASFVESVHKHVDRISDSVLKAFVVFNKIDTLPKEWSEQKMMEELKRVNTVPLHKISSLFSPHIEFHLTSAETNHGLIRLKGSIIKAFTGRNDGDINLDDLYSQIKK